MGDDNKEEVGQVTPRRDSVFDFAEGERNRLFGSQTPNEQEFIPMSQGMWNNYASAAERQRGDYDNIMEGFRGMRGQNQDLFNSIRGRQPNAIRYERSGDMDTAMGGYREFAQTGGYSPTDIQELRARGMSPIRAAYGNTMQEIDRARSLGGGYAPNYIAAASKAQRELPEQMANAMTGVNSELAKNIREGRLAGMSGLQQGSLAEAQLKMRADELTEQGLSNWEARQIAASELGMKGLQSEANLYGTTPGMASAFGNQALQAYNIRNQMEQMRQQFGLGLIDAQLRSLGQQAPPGKPWWQTAVDVGTSVIPFL